MMPNVTLPKGSWDSHLHCFDPNNFPFSCTRAYTPMPAKLEDLVEDAFAENLMVVQASIEDGPDGLAAHLRRFKNEYPNRVVRGTMAGDSNSLQGISDSAWAALHDLGVRSIRLHGGHSGPGNDVVWVKEQLEGLSSIYPVKNLGWNIAAQLPLATWSALKNFITSDQCFEATKLVADHCGCAEPSDFGTPELASFVDLLQTGRLHVKISALHRRSPSNVEHMRQIIQLFAQTAPRSLLWGSDWPHVDASRKGLQPQGPIAVDVDFELRCLQSWLSSEEWSAMLVETPNSLFGN